jgi:hypothetical protein
VVNGVGEIFTYTEGGKVGWEEVNGVVEFCAQFKVCERGGKMVHWVIKCIAQD